MAEDWVAGQPAQATGSVAGRRHSWQEPKGRKESRVRRVAWEPQDVRAAVRSWAVKKARDVLRLLWDMVRGYSVVGEEDNVGV